jgi:hypothetical protein
MLNTHTFCTTTLAQSTKTPLQQTNHATKSHTHSIQDPTPSTQSNLARKDTRLISHSASQRTISQTNDRQPHHNPCKHTTCHNTRPQYSRENRIREQIAAERTHNHGTDENNPTPPQSSTRNPSRIIRQTYLKHTTP